LCRQQLMVVWYKPWSKWWRDFAISVSHAQEEGQISTSSKVELNQMELFQLTCQTDWCHAFLFHEASSAEALVAGKAQRLCLERNLPEFAT
jgi:hypothetical protein